MRASVIAVSGIDTAIGKTWVAGQLARSLSLEGIHVITQKAVQTGAPAEGMLSEDILEHRRIMECGLHQVDLKQESCSQVFSFPASPHLAARLEGRRVDPHKIDEDTRRLKARYQVVLLEGAGGLLVPLTEELLFADYLRSRCHPLLLVTGPRLGSLNHTFLSLEACLNRRLELQGIVYNWNADADSRIGNDSLQMIRAFLARRAMDVPVVELAYGGTFSRRDLAELNLLDETAE